MAEAVVNFTLEQGAPTAGKENDIDRERYAFGHCRNDRQRDKK